MADLDKIELDLNDDGNFDEYNLRDARIDKEAFDVTYVEPRGAGVVSETKTSTVQRFISGLLTDVNTKTIREIPYSLWETLSEDVKASLGHVMITDAPDGLTVAEVNEKVEDLRDYVSEVQTGTLIDGGYGINASFIKRSGLTTMLISGTVTKELTGGTNLIGTIPEGFRPMQQTTGWTIYGNSATVCYVNVYPDGRIYLNYRAMAVGQVVQILPFSYFSR